MNIKVQRTLDRWVGIPACFLFSMWFSIFGSRKPKSSPPQKILVILLSEMGSLVLAQPMFDRLYEKYSGVAVHMLMFAKNREILELTGAVDSKNIITLNDRNLRVFLVDILRALFRLRSERYDVVIDCELFARTSSLFSWLSGAPIRVGFHSLTQEGLYRGDYINRAVSYNPYCHLSQQLITLVEAIDSSESPIAKFPASSRPSSVRQFAMGEDELRSVSSSLHEAYPILRSKRLILIYPGGGILPIRAWPPERYKELCGLLTEQGYAVGLIGLRDDKQLATEIVAHCNHENLVDLTGYTQSIRHLLALFHRAELLITNDGGPAQFSALTPIYSLVFFGPETPRLYSALSDRSWNFYEGYACSPCLTAYNHRNSPCNGKNLCVSGISTQRVYDKAIQVLDQSRSEVTRQLEGV